MRLFITIAAAIVCWLVPQSALALSSTYGVIGAVPSLSAGSSKDAAVSKMVEAGFGMNRHEFLYSSSIDFAPYDEANSRLKARGIQTMGLLLYPGSSVSHDGWKSYVQTVVSRYSDYPAWEIMNEADNYLSPAEYTVYLKEAHDIIKGINGNAKVVLSGITSRPEAPSFWSGVAAAGGWNYFDVAGLHVYHSGNPEKVNFGGGDVVAEFERAVGSLSQNGGGKKIWITETGYESGVEGEGNQANWLARTLIMAKSISAIEKVFIYRLYDGGNGSYGLTNNSFGDKAAFGRIKEVISQLGGSGTGTRLYPQDKKLLSDLESASGWEAKATTNGSLALSTTAGHTGNGLKMAYNFTADQAYAVAEKSIPIEGTPSALAIWIKGDNSGNIWKFRFKDKNGETFQTDLGGIQAEWTYKQFTLGSDSAIVSWDGNGVIDYPISFTAVVIDRQSGTASGEGVIDDIYAITGGADLFAYQFGSTVAYWKVSGSASATLCGATREFKEEPSYASGVSCTDTPKTDTSSSTTTTTVKATPKPKASPVPKVPVDASKSVFRVDGANVLADGKATYRFVIQLKDAAGKLLKDRKPQVILTGDPLYGTLTDPVLVGDEWFVYLSSTQPGERILEVKSDGVLLKTLSAVFVAVPTPEVSVSPSPVAVATPAAEVTDKKLHIPVAAKVLGVLGVLATGGAGGWWLVLYRRRKLKAGMSVGKPVASR
jgi:hypothetical protein